MNIAVLSQGLLSRIVGLSLVKKIRSRYATAFQLHWLPVDQCIELKVLLFTYKAMQGLAPQ